MIGVGPNTAGTIGLGALVDNEDILVDTPCGGTAGESDRNVLGINGAIIDVELMIDGIGISTIGVV